MASLSPVTQRDVARACGVHQSTVCLALKKSPSIPLATRLKVRSMAEELGYRPNAAACNLSLLRMEKLTGGGVPIAWINQEPAPAHWRTDPEARGHFESARRRAGERGYHLEEIWAREPGMTAVRLVGIIRARGIEGVILPVHRHFEQALLTPAWADFALIGLNDHRLADWCDVVCPDHFRNLATACRQARQLGLARPGLVLSPELDAASNGLLHGSFLRTQANADPASRIPVCLLPEPGERRLAAFREWLCRFEPAAVITAEAALVTAARRDGFEATWVGLTSASAPFDGGLVAASSQLGALAVDCVVNKMRRVAAGLGGSSCLHLVQSAWATPGLPRLERAPIVA